MATRRTRTKNGLGVDIGGTGIKAALVDLASGELAGDRTKVDTPQPATPEKVLDVVVRLVEESGVDPKQPVGVTVPGVVHHGVVHSAANIDKSWIGTDADSLLTERLDRLVHVVNDADAAGIAEVAYGAAKDRSGVVIITTLGTGIGSALVLDGRLVPNTELGHLEIDGHDAETRAANRAREEEDLSWAKWAKRLTTYYRTLERLFSPDLFVVGGGISKKADKFFPLIDVSTEMVPAALGNAAGIIGAAKLAKEESDGAPA
jgi:polyphosphate glucokinase